MHLADQEPNDQHEQHPADFGYERLPQQRLIAVHQGEGQAGDRPQEQRDNHGSDDNRRAVFQEAEASDDCCQRIHHQVRDAQGRALADFLTYRFLLLGLWLR